MGDMAIAYVNPEIITWARKRAGLTEDALAKKFPRLSAEHIRGWESGKTRPTLSQADELSERLKVPLLVFYKSIAPDIDVPIPDLRSIGGRITTNLSQNFFDVVADCLVKQRWYKAQLTQLGATPLPFVGAFSLHSSVRRVAESITETIGLFPEFRRELRTYGSTLPEFPIVIPRLNNANRIAGPGEVILRRVHHIRHPDHQLKN